MIKIDRVLVDYTQKLSALFGQFRAIGINYNQVTVALKSHFTEQKAVALLATLQKLTIELAKVGGQIVTLTEEFRAKSGQEKASLQVRYGISSQSIEFPVTFVHLFAFVIVFFCDTTHFHIIALL